MPRLDAYLFFDGDCAEAMRFYEKTLGGKLDLTKVGDSPAAAQMPPGNADKILHARLQSGEGVLMASDAMMGEPVGKKNGFSLALVYPAVPEARRIFDALADGGNVTMPFQKTFWSEGFGMLVDRFGINWMIGGGMQGGAA